jgi:hypothetical protein
MTREGDVWLVAHASRSARVKTSRGLQLLARLVEHTGEDSHVLALASDEPATSLQVSPDAAALAGFLGYAAAVVQHMNIRTPLWIGRNRDAPRSARRAPRARHPRL